MRSSRPKATSKADGEDDPRASFRTVSPGFFKSLGVPIIAGRDFNADDRSDSEKVVIHQRERGASGMFHNQEALNRKLTWTDPVMKFIGISDRRPPHRRRRRRPGRREHRAGPDAHGLPPDRAGVRRRTAVRARQGRPLHARARRSRKIIRDMSAEQPVERAATLDGRPRAEVLAPNRLNTLVFGGFALVALTIAVVGVAGVLAFSVSARMREFGVRLAIGSTPSHLLTRILGEGAVIAAFGIVTGVVAGLVLLRFAGGFFGKIEMPGVVPLAGAAAVLVAAAVIASLMPATRASRVDVMEALRIGVGA